ncbi:hypothetical protein [uncultured Cohaesibacter sp.]|uniref:hypothetical protein n=1 Tax=uncultured Cohaesibacter sp. TaxID=1002546 RepID=UPI0029C94374|nr:hypothetical protein [uncultured Cohaesibacter sp.]
MFMFSRAFGRMMQSREQEARRFMQNSLPTSTRDDILSTGFDGPAVRTRGF